MPAFIRRGTLVLVTLVLLTLTATAANNAEQVVFSTPGFAMSLSGNTIAPSTGFGFWIWCAASAAPGSNGGYQNANACQGSMYFYQLAHTTPVIGFVTEGPDGIYTMQVQEGTFPQLRAAGFGQIPGSQYNCLLTNDTPDPMGPGNGVTVSCAFAKALGGGTGAADVTNAVVNVTGP